MKEFNMKIKHSLCVFLVQILLVGGCVMRDVAITPQEMYSTLDATPSSLDQVFDYLRSEEIEKRKQGISAAVNYPAAYSQLIPIITESVYEFENSEIRIVAARVLGQIGPAAKESVPDLIWLLENDEYIQVKRAVSFSLGQIQDQGAVPALAIFLYSEDASLAGISAKSIAKITGINFVDSEKVGFVLSNGVPTVVLDARDWWEDTGQYLDW